ncbi:hypothetical protein PC129_g15358 [Phytophthora cactorum]|uniref:Uncharacterized protein n=1 Tax=Phytophthora cactorum TaxID=29920 RepID=A0A8T1K4Y4_9STRA|nr:hypothetical protein Pcac1_g15831 [Phytophthora cactorum]KAG2802510.1 hypothetical protein PC112_g19601 [Phytophthora cactorum]KAG2809529.1 hypothetical protein PC111_g16021 [Phytophthora cactorum]KAG2849941.1 hypothetical protein PC113_g17239 [Phytophthora cactorum]KAG2887575.1 hypothetical protein PC114_g18779 [Phytophthora cactorum]
MFQDVLTNPTMSYRSLLSSVGGKFVMETIASVPPASMNVSMIGVGE